MRAIGGAHGAGGAPTRDKVDGLAQRAGLAVTEASEASHRTGAAEAPRSRKEALMAGTMNRRSFLKVSGGASAGLAGILASGRAPAYAQGQKLHMVRWVDFVPAADEALKKQAVDAGKALGAEITIETINANDIQPRITAAISSGSGADIFLLQHNLAHLYAKSLVDVGDIVDAIGKEQGGYYPAAESLAKVDGVWRAAPHVVVGGLDRLPEVPVRRDRRQGVPQDLGGLPRGRQEAQGQGLPDRPDRRPHLR